MNSRTKAVIMYAPLATLSASLAGVAARNSYLSYQLEQITNISSDGNKSIRIEDSTAWAGVSLASTWLAIASSVDLVRMTRRRKQ